MQGVSSEVTVVEIEHKIEHQREHKILLALNSLRSGAQYFNRVDRVTRNTTLFYMV